MTAKEWLGVMQQAEDYNPAMTNLIEKYGELLSEQESISFYNFTENYFDSKGKLIPTPKELYQLYLKSKEEK